MSFKTNATIASFGGKLLKLAHQSPTLGCEMALNLYLPPQATASKKVPVLYYLAGLTCTGDNGAEKGFFQAAAAKKGIAVVFPDTSPSTSQSSHILSHLYGQMILIAYHHHRRTQNRRRRRRLRLRQRRRLLHRRNSHPLEPKLQNVQLHYLRAAESPLLGIQRTRRRESIDLRTQHGRSWCFDVVLEESRHV